MVDSEAEEVRFPFDELEKRPLNAAIHRRGFFPQDAVDEAEAEPGDNGLFGSDNIESESGSPYLLPGEVMGLTTSSAWAWAWGIGI